jgi:ABC-type bacteriocin/lantibiotic exporter with double-glycine peptidase domain
VNGAENRILLAWARLTTPAHRMSVQARRTAGQRSVFLAAYPGFCAVLLYGIGSTMSDPPLPGHFLAFLLAFAQLLGSVTLMSSAISGVATAIPHLERLRPILEETSEVRPGANQPGPLRGHVLVDRVTFRYNRQQGAVLRNVTIEAQPGEFIGIVGPSGSGKSTLLRLLLGFDRPESGGVFYDGQNAEQLDMSAVRRQMGVVLQDTRLMPGDIRSNISGASERTDEEIWRAAEVAAIADDVRAMPMGLQTLVSDDAGPISGGQRQRLLIARAMVSSPRLVIMDEATSALDNLTQATVIQNMRPLRATRIVIAHRLSTIRDCDRIYVLQDGAVASIAPFARRWRATGRKCSGVSRH